MYRIFNLLLLALLSIFLHAGAALAHSAEEHSGHDHASSPPSAEVGLDERLGAKIPLDVVFRDERGKTVRLADLVTGPTIILPVYYSCTNICNFLQGGLARVLPDVRLKPGEQYRVISVSIDETETPELAARYQSTYLSSMPLPYPTDGWRFLTGDLQNIRRLTDAAGYRFQRKGRDFVHPVATFVVTGDGVIVRYLYGTNFLAKDVTLALMEAKSGHVGATIRGMISYCFTFDPATRSYQFKLLRVSFTVILLCCGGFLAYLMFGGGPRRQKSSGVK